MKVVSTYHQPSSVLDSVKCILDGDEYLVVAKLNRVDFYSIHPDGLRLENGIDIWGRVRAVRTVPLRVRHTGYRTTTVLVLTDHPEPELVFLSLTLAGSGVTDLTVNKRLSLFERNSRPAEFLHDVVVSHSGRYAVVSVYTARLLIILLDDEGQFEADVDVSITELNLLSLTFIGVNTLALLHIDFQERLQLHARDISAEEIQLSPKISLILPPVSLPLQWFLVEDHPPRLVFVPANEETDLDFSGGVLVVGGRKILLYDLFTGEAAEQKLSKARLTEKKKRSADAEEASKAKQKEKEREFRKRKARAVVNWPWSEVTATCTLDESNKKFLIGDKFGRLAMLHVDTTGVPFLTLVALGEASSPTTLTYLTNQVVYLGSHFGESQLLRINPFVVSNSNSFTLPVPPSIQTINPKELGATRKWRADDVFEGLVVNGFGSYLDELESFNNLAPIVDALLVDIDGTGQKEIVTCSGGRSTGSLKVVRRGADFKEAATVQGVANVSNAWSLSERYNDPEHTHLIVSTLERTHVFRLDGDRNATVSSIRNNPASFETSSRTLAVANVMRRTRTAGASTYEDSSLVIQVVPRGLLLLEYDQGSGEFARKGGLWTLDKFADTALQGQSFLGQEIVAADINASQVIIALSYRWVLQISLSFDADQFIRRWARQFGNGEEISAVSCVPPDPSKAFTSQFAVSFWMPNHVKMMKLSLRDDNLIDLCRSPDLPAAPRSVLLHTFVSNGTEKQKHPHLLVGLVDGSVVSFVFKDNALVDMKMISIGTLPVSLHAVVIEGRNAVVACGSRASVLCWEKERLVASPLMIKDVGATAYLNTKAYPASMVLAAAESLVIGAVTKFEKVHVRSVPLGYDSPRCIVHCPPWKAFVVACLRTTPAQVGQAEVFSSSVQMFNETSFEKLAQLTVNNGEEVTALHSCTVTLGGVPVSFVCAGITLYDPHEREPSEGRVVLLQTTTLTAVTATKVKGCVYALTSVGDTVVAAVNSSVVLFSVEGTEKSASLRQMFVWNHNYLISTLVSSGDQLLVGDALTSVSLLKMTGSEVELIAKDYGSLWPTSVQLLDEKSLIGANSDYNMFAFRLQQTELQKLLEREGHYFLGDIVNKFIPGALGSHEVSVDDPIEAKQLFFTPTGHIGIVINMGDELSLHMTALQRNLSTYYEQKEGVNHSRFRAPKNNRGRSDSEASSFGFLDGDFLERFLLFIDDPQALRLIMEGQSEPEKLKISVQHIQKVLERLQSMH
ncbi:CPSF A subunit region-domain-containing protein [Scleroderma yunnanense]